MPRSLGYGIGHGIGLDIAFGFAIAFTVFLSVAPANAQKVLSPSSSDSAAGQRVPSRSVPTAAQPPAVDAMKDSKYERSPADRLLDEQNAKLDKIMKGVCRGC